MKCPNCGKEIANDSVYCEYCGVKLEKKGSSKVLWIIIAAVVGVALIACILLLLPKGNKQVQKEEPKPLKVEAQTGASQVEQKVEAKTSASEQVQEEPEEAVSRQQQSPKVESKKNSAKPTAKQETRKEESPVQMEEAISEEDDDDTVFVVVESMPEFPGGQPALFKFLAENVKYPVIAQENGIQGRVVCQFTVSKDGSIRDVEVVRSGGDPSLDKEAMRVIKSMPKWKPGKQRGEPVNVRYTVPVNFKLQ